MNTLIRHSIATAILTSSLLSLEAAETNPEIGAKPAPGESKKKIEHRMVIRHGAAEPEQGPIAFLGVETTRVSPTLTAQLGLASGSGLVVRSVVPGSPAATVLQPHDILLKFEDQLLIESRQLATLIRHHKEGDEIALTYVRGGKQATARVKLGVHDAPKLSWAPDGEFDIFLGSEPGPRPHVEINRMLDLLDEGEGEHAVPHVRPFPHSAGPAFRAMRVHPANSNIVFSDDDGELALTIKDGKKTLVAKSAQGDELFSGPIDTPEQRLALPVNIRERLEKIETMDQFSFRAEDDMQHEFRVLRHGAQKMALPAPWELPAPAPAAAF